MRYFTLPLFAAMLLALSACEPKATPEEQEQARNDSIAELTGLDELKEINTLIKQNPQEAGLYFHRGRIYLNLRRTEDGVADIERAISMEKRPEFFHALADVYIYGNQVPKGAGILEECIEAFPEHVPSLLKMSRLKLYIEDHIASVKFANDVLRLDVTNPQAYFIKGLNYKERLDTPMAISSFQTATEQDPNFYEAYMQLGLLMTDSNAQLALMYFDNAIRIDSTSTEAHYAKGMIYQDSDDFNSARNEYRKIILKDAQNEQAFYNLGYLYYQRDSIDQAMRHFDLAISVAPTYGKAYYMRGACHEFKGNYAEAKKDYNHSLNLQPDFDLAIDGISRVNKQLK